MTDSSMVDRAEHVLTANAATAARELDARAAARDSDRALVTGAGPGDIADAWHALAEARSSRRAFFRKAVAGLAAGGAAAAVGATPAASRAASVPVSGDAEQFRDIRRNENDHLLRLQIVLGQFARPKPTFSDLTQPDFGTFFSYALAFENIGCGAYTAAAPYVSNPDVLALAGPIGSIECRQAGYLNARAGFLVSRDVFGSDVSFETPLFPEDVLFLVGRFFLNLNGGPPLTYARQRGGVQNDLQILNFALAIEQFENEFYNINVPRFFGT